MPTPIYSAGDDGAGYDPNVYGDEGAGYDPNVYGDDGAGSEANVVGAIWPGLTRRFRRQRPRQQMRPQPQTQMGRQIYQSPPLPNTPFQPTIGILRAPVGFGTASWAPTDATNKAFVFEPQESFRGERLIIDSIAVGGTSAGILTVVVINVGTLAQSPSVENAIPAAMFRADATGARMDFQVAYRASKVSMTMGITAAPGAGVTVTAVAGVYGQWLR